MLISQSSQIDLVETKIRIKALKANYQTSLKQKHKVMKQFPQNRDRDKTLRLHYDNPLINLFECFFGYI